MNKSEVKKYFRLIQDNDNHWYIIRVEQEKTFWQWVNYMESEGEAEYEDEDFNKHRINGPNSIVFERYEFVN